MNGLKDMAATVMLLILAVAFLYIMIMGIIMLCQSIRDGRKWKRFRKSIEIGKVYTMYVHPEDPWDKEKIVGYMIDDIRDGYIRYHNIEDRSENPYYRACKIRTFWDRYKDIIIGF